MAMLQALASSPAMPKAVPPQRPSKQDDVRVKSLFDIISYHCTRSTPPTIQVGFQGLPT
jgi:hypothetical protein